MTRFTRYCAALAAGWVLSGSAFAQQPTASPPPIPAPIEAAKPAAMPPPGNTAAPGWNNPPAWRQVETLPQYASVPGRETGVLIEASGRQWRALRSGPVTFYGGIVILVVPVLLLLFYLTKGQIRLHDKPTGRLIERFNSAQRVAHWTMAISFVVLVLTGLTLFFGKYILLPLLGPQVFSTVAEIGKNIHNFVGPLFIFSIVVFFFIYVKDNVWRAYDKQWLKNFGGLVSGSHVASGRFNAGEKIWFWGGVVLLGVIVSISGVILLFPGWSNSRQIMGQADLVHAIFACLFIAASFAHIYLGTIGMQGAYKAMREGFVDETWAREHHELWHNEVKAGKRTEKILSAGQSAGSDDLKGSLR